MFLEKLIKNGKERGQAKFLEGQFCRYEPGRPLIGPTKPGRSVGCAQHFFVRIQRIHPACLSQTNILVEM